MPFVDLNALLITKNKLNGIIYKLKRKYNNEYILSKLVKPLSSRDGIGPADDVVTWDFYRFQACYNSLNQAWIQLSFPLGLIYPTAYSIRGVNNGRCFCNQWEVFGIHEGDENTEANWELLGKNRTSESTYCRILDSNSLCNDINVGTYTLKPMKSKRGFKYLRWRSSGGCSSYCGANYLAVSALEVYGRLNYFSYASNKNIARSQFIIPLIAFLLMHGYT